MNDTDRLNFLVTCAAYVQWDQDFDTCVVYQRINHKEDRPMEGFPAREYTDARSAIDGAIEFTKGRVLRTYEALEQRRFADAQNPGGYDASATDS